MKTWVVEDKFKDFYFSVARETEFAPASFAESMMRTVERKFKRVEIF